MTFEELDALYPNGFSDAYVQKLTLDYQNRNIEVQLSLRGNPPESPNCGEYQRAILVLRDFYYFVIEPPDAEHLWYPERPIQVNGYPDDGNQFPLLEHLKPHLSSDAFCCRFYVHDWNAFIHVAARNAQFSLVKSESPAGLRAPAL